MSIKTTTYIRNPLYVEAVRVTKENFSELALWCQGEIINTLAPDGHQYERYIQVRVTNPMNPRQAQARVGDWILTSDRGYKIYTPKAFANSFYLAPRPGARQLFQQDTPQTDMEEDAYLAPLPVNPPVGSGPMPPQPEPTDVEVTRVPALPENMKSDPNIVYPAGYVYPDRDLTSDALAEEEDDGT